MDDLMHAIDEFDAAEESRQSLRAERAWEKAKSIALALGVSAFSTTTETVLFATWALVTLEGSGAIRPRLAVAIKRNLLTGIGHAVPDKRRAGALMFIALVLGAAGEREEGA